MQVLPSFKKAYVDTGKVRFIFREFSRNPLDVAAFVLARCEGDDKALATIDLLFAATGEMGLCRQSAGGADRRPPPHRHDP